jgi:hypothetical protein
VLHHLHFAGNAFDSTKNYFLAKKGKIITSVAVRGSLAAREGKIPLANLSWFLYVQHFKTILTS